MVTSSSKVKKAVAWSAIESWGAQGISFLVFLVLARLLGPAEFGVVAMAYVYTTLVSVAVDQGFNEAIIQRDELTSPLLSTTFWTALSVSGAAVCLTWLAAPMVANLYETPAVTGVLRWLSLGFLLSALNSTHKALLRRSLAFRSLTIRTLIGLLAGGGLAIWMAYNGYGVWSLVANTVVSGLVGTIILWALSDWRPSLTFSVSDFRTIRSFGLHVMGARMLDVFSRHADNLIIGYFLGPIALGYYSVAYRLVYAGITIVSRAGISVALPAFSRMQHDRERLKNAYLASMQYIAALSFPVFAGVAVLSKEIILTLYGDTWLPAVPILQGLSGMAALYCVFSLGGPALIAVGKQHWNLQLMAVYATLAVVFFLIAVPNGVVAVAYAGLASTFASVGAMYLFVRKILPISLAELGLRFLAPVLATATMISVMFLMKVPVAASLSDPLSLLAIGGVGCATYLVSFFAITKTRVSRVGAEATRG